MRGVVGWIRVVTEGTGRVDRLGRYWDETAVTVSDGLVKGSKGVEGGTEDNF